MPKSQFLNVANISFNAFRENKILAKISEFSIYSNASAQLHIHRHT